MPPRTSPADPQSTVRGVAPRERGVDDRGTSTYMAQVDLGARPGAVSDSGSSGQGQSSSAKPSPSAGRAFTRERFQSALRESFAQAQRRKFRFGRSVGTQPERGARLPAFFDRDFFLLRDNADASESRLELFSYKRPSDAIDAMFFGAAVWSFDCSEFSEVSQLFALRMSLGMDEDGTKQFNQLVKAGFKSRQNPEGRLWISPAASMLFLLKQWFTVPLNNNNYAEGGLALIGKKGAIGMTMSQDAAKHAPVGSLVTFVNTRTSKSPAWKHENAISLGNGEFVAWGVGVVDAVAILQKLSENSTLPLKDQKGTIFIGDVSVPGLPFQ